MAKSNTISVKGRKISLDLKSNNVQTKHLPGGKDVINFNGGELVNGKLVWHRCSAFDYIAHDLAKLPSGTVIVAYGFEASREVPNATMGTTSKITNFVVSGFKALPASKKTAIAA